MATTLERYRQKFRKSEELYEQGRSVIAGGGHQSRPVYPFPVYVDHGQGALKWDVDGNELVDYMMGYGALIAGHAHPKITEAISRRLSQGTHMGTATPLEVRWAEKVKSLIPSAERVRFTHSGGDATLLAMRLSRAYTGRSKVVKFREHFHGWHDYASQESGLNSQVGIPRETLSTVVVVEPEIPALERLLSRDRDIAAVILEPTGAHFGQFPLQNPGFLQDLRELTAKYGVVMIMDEVITGFRLSKGGAQGRFEVLPDLTTMAKIVGGGLPGGAVAGRADIMGLLNSEDASRSVTHPGTFHGNPLSATAGIACLDLLSTEPINERADAMAERLKRGIRDTLSKTEVPGHVYGIASIVHVALGVECGCGGEICTMPHADIAGAAGARGDYGTRAAAFKLAMLNEGVDIMGGIGFMVSSAHREEDIDRTADSFERALVALREEALV